MKKAWLISIMLLALPAALASHTPQGDCDAGDGPSLGIFTISGGTADTTFYVDDRGALGVSIYRESNGISSGGSDPAHDLQRGAPSPVFGPDSCVDDPNVPPDERIL